MSVADIILLAGMCIVGAAACIVVGAIILAIHNWASGTFR